MGEQMGGATRSDPIGLLLAAALGVAALAVESPALAQAPPVARGSDTVREEVIVTAKRDAILTAKVEQALEDDPYLFVGHITVRTDGGVVRLEGFCQDLSDMRQALKIARRVAGSRHVVNEIELDAGGDYFQD